MNEENVKIICCTLIAIAILASCTVSEVTSKRSPIAKISVEHECATQTWINDYCKALADKARK